MEIVERLLDGGFQDECRMRVARIVEEAAKAFDADKLMSCK